MPVPDTYTMITSAAELEPLLAALSADDLSVALDTEADSMHHYREKLCLIQLGAAGRQWIVDPFAEVDLAPLLEQLARRRIIIHGADYDLRLLHRFYNFRPTEVFDTMLAAQLLGRPQIGLASLVQHYCEITLTKDNQRADWAERPLNDEMLAYAADDTRYLHTICEKLEAELEAAGRHAWHAEACARAITNALAPRPPRDADESWRIKGGKHLRGRAAAVLRELWRWREELAQKLDRPPFKVAPGELLIKYALWADANRDQGFYDAPPRPIWLRGSRLTAFDAALSRALIMPPREWPAAPEPVHNGMRLARHEELLLTQLLQARDAVARELGIEPGVLGARDALKGLLRDHPENPAQMQALTTLMWWQAEALAPALLPVLNAPPPSE